MDPVPTSRSARAAQLSVLYLGDDADGTTSLHRAQALERIGHRVDIVNPRNLLRQGPLSTRLSYRTGYAFSRGVVERRMSAALADRTYDLAWVGGGREVSAALVRQLKRRCGVVVNYNNDDPYGHRDGRLWKTFLAALPEYDLVVVLRDVNVREAEAAGARRVHRAWMSYDPVAHRPLELTSEHRRRWGSDVLFVGTWMPERGPFIASLIANSIPVTLYGDRWHKAPEWQQLRAHWRAPFIRGEELALAIQCSRVCLGLLSKGNRDLHTQRSLEIPALGGLLCAERTSEHQALYRDNIDAVFWSTVDECIERCGWLLEDHAARKRIAQSGRQRVAAAALTNDDVVQQIVDLAVSS